MGYGEVIIGDLIREKIVGDRRERWTDRLRDDHNLTDEELATLAPYIEHVSHYGSRKEAIALALVFLPFAFILLALAVFFGGSSLVMVAAIITGGSAQSAGTVGAIGLIMGVVALLPLLLLGLIGYLLYRRWTRYRLAIEVREYLTDNPRRLCQEDDPLSKSRDEIASMSTTTFSDS